jgi:predicted nucleotidyltransferase
MGYEAEAIQYRTLDRKLWGQRRPVWRAAIRCGPCSGHDTIASTIMRRRDEERQSGPYPDVDRATLEAVAAELAAAFPWVAAVYLFGSRARGRSRPSSDTDLAVLAHRSETPEDRILAEWELARLAEDRLAMPVDVVLLRRDLSPGLLFDIFRFETILYAHDWEHAHQVACRARAEYRDLRPRLDRIFERVRQRIKERADALNRA